jgi:hypothetical protein
MQELAAMLKAIPASVTIHLELARSASPLATCALACCDVTPFDSLSNPILMRHLAFKVLPKVNSLGLNEQELLFITKTFEGWSLASVAVQPSPLHSQANTMSLRKTQSTSHQCRLSMTSFYGY